MFGEKTLRISLGVVGVAYVLNFVVLGFLVGPFDYDHLASYYELAWHYWMSADGLPHFNPFFCGGRTLGGDPQVPIFHPFVLLVPLIGAPWLIRLELFLQLVAGVWGLWAVMKLWDVPREGRLWGVLIYIAGGGLVSRFLVGHFTLGFYALYPLFFYFSYRLQRLEGSGRHKLFALYGLLFIYCGLYKPNFIIFGVPPLLIEHAIRSWLKRDVRPLLYFFGAVGLCLMVNAVTYLPAWKYFSDFPRGDDRLTKFAPLYAFISNLIFPLKGVPERLYGPVFMQRHEYSVFVGPAALVFAFLGGRQLSKRLKAEWASLLVFAVISIWIGMGATEISLSWYSPYSWFREFWPGFKSIRVPVRFWFSAFLVICLFSAAGFHLFRKKWSYALWMAVGVIPLVGNALANLSKVSLFSERVQWIGERMYPGEFSWVMGSQTNMYQHIKEGRGVLDCVANVNVYQSPDVVEGPVFPKSSGVVMSQLDWNKIKLAWLQGSTDPIALNLNHSPYWQLKTPGRILSKLGEKLRVAPNGGEEELILEFNQPYLKIAITLSLVSLSLFFFYGIFAFMRWDRQMILFPLNYLKKMASA